jgi:UDP-N-acetylmuramoylalanine--D-glutamate ligase
MDDFGTTLAGHVPFERSLTLAAAINSAARDAGADKSPESVVLLSPACASYDQFQNFERRGDAFRSLALALDGVENRGEAA